MIKQGFLLPAKTVFILMAHNLDKKVIPEGAETQAQVACLKYLDCDVIQGYYYAKPMFMEELIQFLETSR